MPPLPGADAPLSVWLDYLLAIHPTEIDMGLERVTQVATRLGVLSLGSTKVITVAGTNGKGSTCRMLEQIMRAAGYRVGVYSSPHILNYNERVRIDGVDAPDSDFISAFEIIEAARGDTSLTFFEYATLAGLLLFKQAKLDLVILEVGLGGRLDATNIIDADVSVVTAIDLDHQAYLGDTRELVGREKAGIFRHNRPAIVGDAEMPASVVEVANEKGALLKAVGQAFCYKQTSTGWDFCGEHWQFEGLPKPQLPLPNAATSLAALEQLWPELSEAAIRSGLTSARLSGRMEHISEAPLIILDVAHNPHAARYLAQRLDELQAKGRVYGVCGMLKDKDIEGVMQALAPSIDSWLLVTLHNERGADAGRLRKALPDGCDAREFEQMQDCWQYLKPKLGAEDVVIVFGSFYTVSGFKALI
ncbi:bifunctional tetrahydrofolate synthase/dihydrofolate synthase [Shewanella indica]|nr:bifunctional tetrahydrofolate synthase/dihydrofolate synthase [Shewanella indica]MCE9790517.1 bifunctional tetrahydrofolate synthase/dihydrofolate synthase [Shewanella indica]